jgi:glycosyltransferase involved in cell wall biosynthesis
MSPSVAIDVRRATWAPQAGIARYSRCLVDAMLALEPSDLEVRPLDIAGSGRWQRARVIRIGRGHHFAQRFVQEQVAMVRISRGVDLLHLPWFEGPILPGCPLVVNVHDLETLEYARSYSLRFRAYYNALLRIYVRTARRIIVPSKATLTAVGSRWPHGRYVLVPYGVDPLFEEPVEGARDEEDPYILYSGGFGPRKRLGDLLDAFDRIAEAERHVRLVIVGTAPKDVVRAVARSAAGDRIDLVGYVEDLELVRLYRSASVVAYPSVLEGFGFPVVEAFATETPVVATASGSIPEIVGEAGLLVQPKSPVDLAEALLAVLRDRTLAARLAAAGRKRVGLYRWSETARRTLAVYREALE